VKWKPGSQWYIKAEGGSYTVSKALVEGKPKYQAWYRSEQLGDVCPDGQAAKKLCAEHQAATDKVLRDHDERMARYNT